ncbi:MAG: hypothetical protein DRJ42_15665, partial [Deltaproteobacteria bacterium]
RALDVQDGSRLDALRLLTVDNHDVGLFAAAEGTEVSLVDAVIRDTWSTGGPNGLGRGINVQEMARIGGERVRIEGTEEAGLLVAGGAIGDLRDVEVTDVMLSTCEPGACSETPHGYAVVTLGGALRLTRFELRDAAVCGIVLAPLAGTEEVTAVDLETGVVSNSPIGACVQIDGYDLDRLTGGVHYRDNGSNLDSTMLPVPSLAGEVAP